MLIILLSEVVPVFEIKNPFQRKNNKKTEFVLHKIFSVGIGKLSDEHSVHVNNSIFYLNNARTHSMTMF